MKEYRAWKQIGRKKSMRLLAMLLAFCLMFTTCPEILETLYVFAATGQEEKDTVYVAGFDNLSEEVKEQTVSVGTGLDELTLPETLEASVIVSDKENDTEDAGQRSEETKSEEADTKAADMQAEEASDEETETNDVQMEENTQDNPEPSEEADGTEESTVTETADDTENSGESLHSETYTVTMEEYYAENVVTVETLTADDAQTETITGVTWTSEPEYDGNTEGTYIFTAVLPEGYALMEGVSLPQITVTVQENEEETEDTEVQALLDRIAALPDLEEYLAAEPDGDEDAYEEWLETLYVYAEEALAIWEEYEILTKEQKAQIPETELAKLTAWAEFAETLADSMAVMTVATTVASGTCGSGVTWTLDSDGTLTISGSGEMTNYTTYSAVSWYNYAGDIKMVTIENGVTSIGAYAFYDCGALESIEIPESVTSIGDVAFNGCSSLESIEIPSGVTSIGSHTFLGCSALESIEIPENVTSIGNYAFYGCSSLTSIKIPSGVTGIGSYTFMGCSLLESIEIPENVTSIGEGAFYGCSSLTSIKIPSGVTGIGNYTFMGCSLLESIEIPENVTSIGISAFNGCSALALVIMERTSPATLGTNVFKGCKFVADSRKDLVVPAGTRDDYISATNWDSWAAYIHEDHDSITWTAWTDSTSLPGAAGNYYLATDVTLNNSISPWTVPSGETRLCLNGHTVTFLSQTINIESGSTLYICDCDEQERGSISNSRNNVVQNAGSLVVTGGSLQGTDASHPAIMNKSGGTVTIRNGKVSVSSTVTVFNSGSLSISGGSIISSNSAGYAVNNNGIIELSGSPTLTGSKADINLRSGAYIAVTGTLTGKFSIATADTPTVDAPVILTNSTTIEYNSTDNFTPTDASYKVQKNSSGQLELAVIAYTVTYDYAENGGSSATKTTATVAVGDAIDLTPTATKAGWTFVGWNTDKNAETGLTSLNMGGEDITLYAIYTPNTYTVKLNGNGGSGGTTLTSYTCGTGATLPDDWTKTYYTFAGWYDNADCTGTEVTEISTTDTGDKEYWAKWIPVSYTITYNLNGGTATGNPTSYTIESSAITLINPTKEGYTFTGWSGTGLTGSGNTNVTIASGSTGDREYTANWTANSYTVTLRENGGNGTTLTSYTCGTGAALPTDWTKTGYTFAGWYDNENCTGTEVTAISTTDLGDKEYWAKWVDDIAPVIGDLSYSYKPKNLWHWLIGKDSLMITVPVTEEGSGADEITYTITPEGGTAEQRTAAIKDGEATITLSADFQGTIAITCTDKDGNTSAGVTAGAALDADGKGFLIEDNAPEITFAANNGAGISSEYYDTAPDITVTVTDDADNAISAGIASITYQIGTGEEIPVNKDFTAQMVADYEFSIVADDIPTGEIKITVTATDNAGNEASETITVKVKGPESKPAAAINYQTEMLTGLEPNADYTINDTAYQADADGCIAIDENWIGTTIELVRKGNGTETTDSEAQEISFSARPSAPSIMPELDSRTDSSITLKAIDGVQYHISGGNWQDGTEFTGLAAGTEYTFTVRYEATATAFSSEESAPASFYTLPSAPAQGAAQIDYAQETLTLADGVEAFTDEACTVPIASGSISDYIGQTIYIRYAADGEIPASGVTAVTIPERPSAPAAGTQNATYPGAADGKITGLLENTAYEIRKKNDDGTWGEWTNVVLTGTEISNLAAGEYEIRIQAVEGESFQSEATSVTIHETPATSEATPEIRIDYRQEILTGFIAGEEYKITVNEKTITVTADADGTLKLEEEWLGATVSIVKSGNGKDKLDSEAQSVSIPARTAQTPSPGAEDESSPGAGDGKLTGLEAGKTYQISTDNGATWTDVTADANGEITNLAPGSYIVRIGSTDTDFASNPSALVTIAAYLVTYTVTLYGNGGSGTALTSYTYGEGAVLPTDWTKTGYTFGGWYDNEDCTGTAVTAISATDAGDKEYWAKWNKKSSDSSDNGSDDSTDNSDNDTGNSDNNTDNSDNETGDSDNKEQPETPIVPDNQPDDKKEPTDESRDDTDSTQQEGEETPEQTEASKDTDTTNRIPEGETVQTVPVEVEDGKLVLTGESVETGNLTDTSKTTTVLTLGDGAVIVTVNCEDDHYTAGVKDTVAVANIVLTPEQLQLVYDGEVIEIRIDVNDISQTVGEQDKAVIEQGLEAWRQEIPELTLGMYVDISMFIRIGESDWDAITFTEEPIDIVIGIPQELKEDGRKFYIIRSHEGEYTLLNDMDSDADTITISTDSFSAYAIAYQQVDSAIEEVTAEKTEESAKCGLCHICPTFLGICCFIWLAVVVILILIAAFIIMRKRKEKKKAE